MTVSEEAEVDQLERLKAWRAARDAKAVAAALADLKRAAKDGTNIMPASIACAKAGVTTGEWGWTLRDSFGEYRAPTGVGSAMRNDVGGLDDIRADVDRVSRKLGRRLTFLVGKPGLDGHSNGAEQIAVRARDAGMQVVYQGIRLTPEEIVEAAREQKAHVVGLSILSGSHLPLVRDVIAPAEAGRHRRRAGGGRRHHSARGRRRARAGRRRRGLHAEGFRAEPHHVRSCADRGQPHRRRLTAPCAKIFFLVAQAKAVGARRSGRTAMGRGNHHRSDRRRCRRLACRPDRARHRLRADRQHHRRHRRRVHCRMAPADIRHPVIGGGIIATDHQRHHRRGDPAGDHRPDQTRLTRATACKRRVQLRGRRGLAQIGVHAGGPRRGFIAARSGPIRR